MLGRIRCYFGKHVRSRGRARRTGNGWHSYCRRCDVEMFKEDGGEWYVVPDVEDLDEAELAPVADLDAEGGERPPASRSASGRGLFGRRSRAPAR